MEATAYFIPGQIAYMSIPASSIRSFSDGMFPQFAKFPGADFVQGANHRYKAGHDILLDVPNTFFSEGIVDSFKHFGHVVLTDFPTKAGIPIPGFSQSGLGGWLESMGIGKGWMSVNICDAGVGLIAVREGHTDLIQALDGTLAMNAHTFFDTFVEGGVEVAFSLGLQNPILFAGGLQNLLAGVVSAWNTVVVSVDPIAFFGSALCSAVIGFSVSQLIAKKEASSSILTAFRSSLVGGLFVVCPPFGFGAVGGLLAYEAGVKFAEYQNRRMNSYLSIDKNEVRLFLEELVKGNPDFMEFLTLTKLKGLPADSNGFCTILGNGLRTTPVILDSGFNAFDRFTPFGSELSMELDGFRELMD